MFDNLARFLQDNDAQIVSQDVFGCCALQSGGMEALRGAFGEIKWPITWIEGEGPSKQLLTGTQAYAISGTSAEPIRSDECIIGNVFEDDDARYCLLGDLRPADSSHSDTEQARETFEKMEQALGHAQMDFSHVVRTWLYNAGEHRHRRGQLCRGRGGRGGFCHQAEERQCQDAASHVAAAMSGPRL
ncbi:MAG: RidA family protein [Planctomycetota bacterium]|jgi:hypothetical protein